MTGGRLCVKNLNHNFFHCVYFFHFTVLQLSIYFHKFVCALLILLGETFWAACLHEQLYLIKLC